MTFKQILQLRDLRRAMPFSSMPQEVFKDLITAQRVIFSKFNNPVMANWFLGVYKDAISEVYELSDVVLHARDNDPAIAFTYDDLRYIFSFTVGNPGETK